ncbi:MAG: hypothetical protein LBR36_01475 [Bacteroidales bacterium]|nr:hypothetical protein [Bacteroidales bacterium]
MIYIFYFTQNAKAQNCQLVKELNQTFEQVAIDKLGFVYASDGGILYKYDTNGDVMYSYSDLSAGRITHFDVSNPLKILVFSKDFLTITFLDNKLSPQKRTRLLTELELSSPLVACLSYDNGFWIYDHNENKLFRYNAESKLTHKTHTVNHLTENKIEPHQLAETQNGYLILCDSTTGMLIFDHYGTYIKTIPLLIVAFSLHNQGIVYVADGMLNLLNIETLETKQTFLPRPDIIFAASDNHLIAALTQQKTLVIFKIVE